MHYAVILAGGIGKRFWPLSNIDEPKQFLSLLSDRCLLEDTILRIKEIIDVNNIYIATNKVYKKKFNLYINKFKLKRKNLLFEPEIKNTFLPIAYLTYQIFNKDPQAKILVFPADHCIKDKDKFLSTLKEAVKLADEDFIVTLGIKPTYPSTDYGYIKIKRYPLIKNKKIFKVERFIEKPSLVKAKRFIKDKRFFWNAGIFIFKAKFMLQEIEHHQPSVYQLLHDYRNIKELWYKAPSLSIDYAIMEKSKRLALIPFVGFWSDLGSFKAVEELLNKDTNQNIFKCRVGYIDKGSKNIFVWSDNRFVVTVGLKDLYIIETKNGLLVCEKDKIKELIEILRKKNN